MELCPWEVPCASSSAWRPRAWPSLCGASGSRWCRISDEFEAASPVCLTHETRRGWTLLAQSLAQVLGSDQLVSALASGLRLGVGWLHSATVS